MTWTDDAKEVYELESFLDDLERQRHLYEETDQDNWTLQGADAPVDDETVRYSLGPIDSFMDLWNSVDDTVKELKREYANQPGRVPRLARRYREIQDRIFDNEEFISQVYGLDKPIGRLKVEARYT